MEKRPAMEDRPKRGGRCVAAIIGPRSFCEADRSVGHCLEMIATRSGLLKIQGPNGSPISVRHPLSRLLSSSPTRSLRGSWPPVSGEAAPEAGPHRDTHGREGTCAPFPPSRWGIWAPVNGIVPILSSFPPPPPPLSALFLELPAPRL